MGVKGGPNIPDWDFFDRILDSSSIFSYPGIGIRFTNPLRQIAGDSATIVKRHFEALKGRFGIT